MDTVVTPGRATARGIAVGLVGIGSTLLVLLPFRERLASATPALILMLVVVAAAIVGGTTASVVTAAGATLTLNLAFIEPFGALAIKTADEVITLVAFVVVALVVGQLVGRLARRRIEVRERQAELAERDERLAVAQQERVRLASEASRAEQLEHIDLQRAALLRSVSHDLRTPLAAIRTIATDLRDGVEYDAPTRTELLTTVCDEVDRLDRLVANLLSLSRIEAGAFAPDRQAIDLAELVGDRIRRLAPLLIAHTVRIDLPAELPLLDGDYAQLEQVLTNLIANAVRHAPAGSDLWIVATVVDSQVRVEVSDHGPGIPEHERDVIFRPFRRGEGSRSTGIGLAICRSIVEAHGGTIGVERTFGGGATFHFTIPAMGSPT
jgi:two-component system sensor histidine kinase KdpD